MKNMKYQNLYEIIEETSVLMQKFGIDITNIKSSLFQTLNNKYDVPCEYDVINLLENIKAGYDREIRYRLEKKYYHNITAKIISRLENYKIIKRTGLRGTKIPTVFYRKYNTEYDKNLINIMKKKLYLYSFINSTSSTAGIYAQILWKQALEDSGFNILDEETNSFGNIKSKINGDIDYIAEKDKIKYGIEIKNSLSYPRDLMRKMLICIELGLIPLFIVRWMSKTQFYNIWNNGGLIKIYETSIYPHKYKKTIKECREILGYPMLSINRITKKPKKHLNYIHGIAVKNIEEIMEKNRDFIKKNNFIY